MKHFIAAFMVLHISLLMLGKPSKASPLDNYSEKDSFGKYNRYKVYYTKR